MLKFVIKRIFAAIPQLLVVMTLIFFMIRIIPGDPAIQILGEDAKIEDIEALREQWCVFGPPLLFVRSCFWIMPLWATAPL